MLNGGHISATQVKEVNDRRLLEDQKVYEADKKLFTNLQTTLTAELDRVSKKMADLDVKKQIDDAKQSIAVFSRLIDQFQVINPSDKVNVEKLKLDIQNLADLIDYRFKLLAVRCDSKHGSPLKKILAIGAIFIGVGLILSGLTPVALTSAYVAQKAVGAMFVLGGAYGLFKQTPKQREKNARHQIDILEKQWVKKRAI